MLSVVGLCQKSTLDFTLIQSEKIELGDKVSKISFNILSIWHVLEFLSFFFDKVVKNYSAFVQDVRSPIQQIFFTHDHHLCSFTENKLAHYDPIVTYCIYILLPGPGNIEIAWDEIALLRWVSLYLLTMYTNDTGIHYARQNCEGQNVKFISPMAVDWNAFCLGVDLLHWITLDPPFSGFPIVFVSSHCGSLKSDSCTLLNMSVF